MGIDSAHGVIDEYGEVHGHRGLDVVDGAAVPSATGVNPSAPFWRWLNATSSGPFAT
jgi:cholesterol oxidase